MTQHKPLQAKKSTIYDGKLTAWLDHEITDALIPGLPPESRLYEGKTDFEIQTLHPRFSETREKLIAIAREYSRRERATPPVNVEGDIDHGCND